MTDIRRRTLLFVGGALPLGVADALRAREVAEDAAGLSLQSALDAAAAAPFVVARLSDFYGPAGKTYAPGSIVVAQSGGSLLIEPVTSSSPILVRGMRVRPLPRGNTLLFEDCNTPSDYDPVTKTGTGVTDLLVYMDQVAATAGVELVFMGRGYAMEKAFCGTVPPYNVPGADWASRHPEGTDLLGLDEAASQWIFNRFTTTRRARQSHMWTWQGTGLNTPKWLLENQTAGLNYVTFKDLAQFTAAIASGELYPGLITHVCGGKNNQDADDPLWRYDQLHKVARWNEALGRVYFHDTIDLALTDDGWIPGQDKNLAIDWATGQTIAVGDYRWFDYMLHRAKTAGVTAGSFTVSGDRRSVTINDTGVQWEQITTRVVAPMWTGTAGSEKDGITDYRPMMQPAEHVEVGRTFTGIHFIAHDSGAHYPRAFQLGSNYQWTFRDGSIIGYTKYDCEASRYTTYERMLIDTNGMSTYGDACGNYNARKIRHKDCTILGGGLYVDETLGVVSVESYGEMIFEGGSIDKAYRSTVRQTLNYAVSGQMGEIKIKNVKINSPHLFSAWQTELAEDPDYITFQASGDCEWRGASPFAAPMYGARYYDRVPEWMSAFKLVEFDRPNVVSGHNIALAPIRNGRVLSLPITITKSAGVFSGVVYISRADLIKAGIVGREAYFLGASGISVNNDATATVFNCRAVPLVYDLDRANGRGLLAHPVSTAVRGNYLLLEATKPYDAAFMGRGTAVRFVDLDKEIIGVVWATTTGNTAAAGTISLTYHFMASSDLASVVR